MTNFEKLAEGIDVSKLMCVLHAQPALFDEVTDRQTYPGSSHKQTKSVFVRWCARVDIDSAFNSIPAFDFPAMGKLPEARELINYALHTVGGQQLGRVLIVSLRPGGSIEPHADEGAYADHYERFHIVLKSECVFQCGDESVAMKVGELWWFNHKQEHQVYNHSADERIHLIIDCVAPRFRRERNQPVQQPAISAPFEGGARAF